MSESREQVALREWYELLKADDPAHFAGGVRREIEDGCTVSLPYTFEMFCTSPIVRFGVQSWARALAKCALEEAKWWNERIERKRIAALERAAGGK